MSKNEKLHREMWHWIAEETRKQKEIVWRFAWFDAKDLCEDDILNCCFACQEAMDRAKTHGDLHGDFFVCGYCPLTWDTEFGNREDEDASYVLCDNVGTLYDQWIAQSTHANWQEAADLADQIAEMEWKEEEQHG